MTRGRRDNRSASSRAWLGAGGRLAHLLLVLFAFRAMIPVGYMPDPAALQDGRFEIVVCTPAGLKTVTVAPDKAGPADAEAPSSENLSATDCPFHLVLAKALVLPDHIGVPLDWEHASAPVVAPTLISVLRPALLGPPLGSRAPPISAL